MSKYDMIQPNRQFNDFDSIEQQIMELDKRIDEAQAGETSFDKISGEPEDNVKLKEALDSKANADDVYTKSETDTLLDGKSNVGDSYTKSEEDALLADKADKTDLDSLEDRVDGIDDNITDIQTDLTNKVDKVEGKELMDSTLPTQVNTNKTDIDALKLRVEDIQIIQLRTMPQPSADYLGKIVQYIGPTVEAYTNGYFYQCDYDTDLADYTWIEKLTQPAGEVDLSNYYTKTETDNILQNKQDKLTAGDGIKITGNTIMQNILDDTISSASTTWSSRYLESLFHSLSGLSAVEIVDERPAVPTNNTMYYIKDYEEGEEPLYQIWFYQNNTWTNFGTTAIDLTNYYTKAEVDALLANKQATLTEGTGIRISNNNVEVKIDGTTIKVNSAGNLYVEGGGGGGFEPTSAQLAAMNSGITQAKREDYDTSLEDVSQLKSDMTQAQSDITDLDTNKADKSDTYTKTEVDTELGKKLDKRTGEGVGVYSHSGSTQGEFSVKTTMPDTPTDTELVTAKGVKTYVDGKDPLAWNYVGILGAATDSTIKVGDDWRELCIIMRLSEGTFTWNYSQIISKAGFTEGSPTRNTAMFGFMWNASYKATYRMELSSTTGDNRTLKRGYGDLNGWGVNGFYIYKR